MDYYILLFGTRKDIYSLMQRLMGNEEEDYDVEAMFKSYASFFWFYAAQSLYAATKNVIVFYSILRNNSSIVDSLG